MSLRALVQNQQREIKSLDTTTFVCLFVCFTEIETQMKSSGNHNIHTLRCNKLRHTLSTGEINQLQCRPNNGHTENGCFDNEGNIKDQLRKCQPRERRVKSFCLQSKRNCKISHSENVMQKCVIDNSTQISFFFKKREKKRSKSEAYAY